MTRPDARRNPRRPTAAPPSGGRWAWAAVITLLMVCLVGWLWLGRGDGLVEKTLDMERSLLAAAAPGRAGRRAVDQIIRNVDRMQPDELQEVQRTLDEEWQRVRREDIEAYFAAQSDEKRSILDRSIDRALMYKELRFAVNPKARSRDGRKPPKSRAMATRSLGEVGATAAEKAARRQLLERYDDALRRRARERRIDLPAWQ